MLMGCDCHSLEWKYHNSKNKGQREIVVANWQNRLHDNESDIPLLVDTE